MTKTCSVLLFTSMDPRRLKVPPDLLPFGDQSVLRRTVDAYLSLRPREMVIVSAEKQDRVQEALGHGLPSVTVVTSPEVRGRPGLAVKLGLERLASEPEVLLVGLGDQPLLSAELLSDLGSRYEQSQGVIGVPVCQGIPGHPVFIPARFLEEMRAMGLDQTHRTLILNHPNQVTDLETEESSILRRIEDPEAYKELLSLAGLPAPPPPEEPEPPPPPAEEAETVREEPPTEAPAEAAGEEPWTDAQPAPQEP